MASLPAESPGKPCSFPGQGTEIPKAAWHGQKKKRRRIQMNLLTNQNRLRVTENKFIVSKGGGGKLGVWD